MAAKEYFSLQKQEHRKGCCDVRSGCCACLLFFLIALLIAAVVTGFIFLIMWQADHDPVVETNCGPVEGAYCPHSNSYIFRGIPYAAPPVADLRWLPAAALKQTEAAEGEEEDAGAAGGTCWEGVYEAKKRGDVCMHVNHFSDNKTAVGSEDCLYLNVFSPNIYKKNESRPVVVFVHGEDGTDHKYQPGPKMASDMDMVFVTLQYRIGPMGFLVLGEENGNYGLTDLIEALKWVKENIANFGGNPKDVTLIGQGTGSTCVLTLVASPEATGLFHRAWAMSGSGLPTQSKADVAEKDNKFILAAMECDDVACLRNASAAKVTELVEEKWLTEDIDNLPKPNIFPFARIVVDGSILPVTLTEALGGVTGSDVPLMIGSAAQSVDYDPVLNAELRAQTTAEYLEYLDTHINKENREEALGLYNFTSRDDPEYKLTTLITDCRFACAHDDMARRATDGFSSDVYRYIIERSPSSEVNAFGAAVPAKYAFRGYDLYGFLAGAGQDMAVGETDADKKYQDGLREIAAAFISGDGEGAVKPYSDGIAFISDDIVMVKPEVRKQICDFWNDNFNHYRAMY